jgi:hypothetical protein
MVPNVTDPTYPTFASIWDDQMKRTKRPVETVVPNWDALDVDRHIAIFGPLADLIRTKDVPMETACNCTMQFQRTCNDNHDDNCPLWHERTFWDGDDYWDGEAQRLATAPLGMNGAITTEFPYIDANGVNPYENAEQFIWDGDTPVISKAIAAERAPKAPVTCDQEDEAVAAMVAGAMPDEYGWVQLPDGSWVDMENRVTYRAIKDDDGQECWVEELWDDPTFNAQTGEIADCRCNPEKVYWCVPCGVTRDNKGDAWRFQTALDKEDYDNGWDNWTSNTCTHALDPIQLKGVVVYASKVRKHTTDTTPDLGCYAYGGWNPSSPALFIPWQDYGLPTCSYVSAAKSIKAAFTAAKDGEVVEVGCMGGHGRTGTILACMAVLADPELTGPEAVKYIQRVHCNKAVETSSQEWFVRWFRAWANGETFTEMEPKGWSYDSSKTSTTTVTSGHSRGEAIHVTVRADGTTEEIFADGTIVTTFGGTADSTPKGGNADGLPNGEWCTHCKRNVFSWHNQDCPSNVEAKVWMPEERTDGNVAPGATANARRRAETRQRRAEGAKRAKARRQSNYRNTPERVC